MSQEFVTAPKVCSYIHYPAIYYVSICKHFEVKDLAAQKFCDRSQEFICTVKFISLQAFRPTYHKQQVANTVTLIQYMKLIFYLGCNEQKYVANKILSASEFSLVR